MFRTKAPKHQNTQQILDRATRTHLNFLCVQFTLFGYQHFLSALHVQQPKTVDDGVIHAEIAFPMVSAN